MRNGDYVTWRQLAFMVTTLGALMGIGFYWLHDEVRDLGKRIDTLAIEDQKIELLIERARSK